MTRTLEIKAGADRGESRLEPLLILATHIFDGGRSPAGTLKLFVGVPKAFLNHTQEVPLPLSLGSPAARRSKNPRFWDSHTLDSFSCDCAISAVRETFVLRTAPGEETLKGAFMFEALDGRRFLFLEAPGERPQPLSSFVEHPHGLESSPSPHGFALPSEAFHKSRGGVGPPR